MHEAELNSAIASIWILPPGQVTETSFSPGLQMSSHLVFARGLEERVQACRASGPCWPRRTRRALWADAAACTVRTT